MQAPRDKRRYNQQRADTVKAVCSAITQALDAPWAADPQALHSHVYALAEALHLVAEAIEDLNDASHYPEG